ncbi:MAG: MFS transporter [Alistipes sp.]|nr:MFS transporter [Alistipes sp.]
MSNMGDDVSSSRQDVENITKNYVSTLFKDDVKKSDESINKVVKVFAPEQSEDGYTVAVRYTLKSNPTDTLTATYNFSNENFMAVKSIVDKAQAEERTVSASEIAKACNLSVAQAKATQTIITRAEHSGAWKWSFWLPGLIALLGAVGLFAFLRDTPKSVGLPELEVSKTSLDGDGADDKEARKAFVRKMVYKNPIIWGLAFANFFVYVVRFSVLDWGPKFLTEACSMSYEKAGIAVAAFEIMAIVGTLVAGWFTDKFFAGRSHRTCLLCMLGAGASMGAFYYFYLNPGMVADELMIGVLAMAGFFVYGPQALIGIAAANHATKKAAATANGLVGIFGYLSTAVSGIGMGWLADKFGWNYVFIGVIAMAIVGVGVFILMWGAKRDGYDKANA